MPGPPGHGELGRGAAGDGLGREEEGGVAVEVTIPRDGNMAVLVSPGDALALQLDGREEEDSHGRREEQRCGIAGENRRSREALGEGGLGEHSARCAGLVDLACAGGRCVARGSCHLHSQNEQKVLGCVYLPEGDDSA